jgi:predicted dehydrogenase/threonine dehydrogenase-like Zn-dependent dehydrogenase
MRQLVMSPKQKGRIADVPGPSLRRNGVMVRVQYSAVSVGTERAAAEQSHKSLLEKAKSRPDQVKQVLKSVQKDGIKGSMELVKGALERWAGSGYSCAGTVVAVGADVSEFHVGDRVVCAGGGYAFHAEYVSIPRRLVAKVPDGVPLDQAAFATIGAIAMHGFRIAEVNVSEHVAVMGLGIIGQLACQIASAAGANVTAMDVNPQRVELALTMGAAHHGITIGGGAEAEQAKRLTNGRGYDAVLLCAATSSNDPIHLAEAIARDRGNLVVVGDVGLGLQRGGMFEKELSLRVSRSYGPGRYDPSYEEQGGDYPYGFVRWTEQRNLESFVNLIERGKLNIASLITHRFPFEQVEDAFNVVVTGQGNPIGIVLEYPESLELPSRVIKLGAERPTAVNGSVGIGFIGAGSFSRSVLLPALKNTPINPVAILASTGVAATQLGQTYGFSKVATDAQELFNDDSIRAAFIVTRHDSHARYAMDALKAGKAVFVEKPLATTEEDLLALCDVQRQTGGTVMVGFNRRFAPQVGKMRKFFGKQHGPLVITMRVNAGAIPKHWSVTAEEGGGRIIGEACHFVDLIQAIAGSRIKTVFASSVPVVGERLEENICANFVLEDGSIASLNYNALGDTSFPKEYIEVFGDGKVATLNDFRDLTLVSGGKSSTEKQKQDKGHASEMQLFVESVQKGLPCPIPFEQSVSATLATFAILESCRLGEPVDVASGGTDS